MLDTLKNASSYFRMKEPVVVHALKQARWVSSELSKIKGVIGVAGTGYPYYAISDRNSGVLSIPSIYGFISRIMKEISKPTISQEKRERLIRFVMPDLDTIIISDGTNPNLEQEVLAFMKEHQFDNLRQDFSSLISNFQELFIDLEKEQGSKRLLPLDIHICDISVIKRAASDLRDGKLTEIPVRSFHGEWENYKLNFGFDFLMSLTMLSSTPELEIYVKELRQRVRVMSQEVDFPKIIRDSFPRGKAILGDTKVLEQFLARIANWD